MTRRCLDALLTDTKYSKMSVILVDNWSISDEAQAFTKTAAERPGVSVMRVEEPFNYSRLNNLACAEVKSDFIVFMNNDVLITQPDWLRAMVNEALADPDIGAVGAKLLYPNGTTQHAGVVLGVDGVGDHAFRGRAAHDPFYMGRGICAHEASAVTAALMLCRTSAFNEVGGFDEKDLAVAYNDVDLCLQLLAAGWKIVQAQSILAEHHESVSRGDDLSDAKLGRFLYEQNVVLSRWGDLLRHDSSYNPNFSLAGGIYRDLSLPALKAEELPATRYRQGRPARKARP